VPLQKLFSLLRRTPVIALGVILLFFAGNPLHAQVRYNVDSANQARQQALATQRAALEAQRAENKRVMDSARVSRAHILDSVKTIRQRRADSMASVRKYRESRRFQDSVKRARADRLTDMREAQKDRSDSVREVRQRSTDSVIAIREAATAVFRKAQQQRTDSLARIRKYRDSKRFADSVAIVRKARTDSLREYRKSVADSIVAIRKATMDSTKAVRKVITDSLTAVRKQRTDSLTQIRKQRAEATAKRETDKKKKDKERVKDQEKKQGLALEIKIKKKRSIYSNENMLKKKWSLPRQGVQNLFTHFNYYFNANRKMEEAEANMERAAKDQWDSRIPLFSFDPLRDSAMFAADMDSVIQKSSLGIQIHDPRTKWGDDLYLLLGKAYYYKGDRDNATAAFRYVVAMNQKAKADAAKKSAYSNSAVRNKKREVPSIVTPDENKLLDFLKHQPANNESLLWLARTYTTYGSFNDAESVLDLLSSDSKFPEDLKGRLALEQAFYALRHNNDPVAARNLDIVVADGSLPNSIRRRAAFLNGQILQDAGKYTEAAAQFAKVTNLSPKVDLDFYARRNRAYALMMSGGVQKDAIASLKSMLNDGKYSAYHEQIYYVLGRLSDNSGDTPEAIAYLRKGIASTKSTKKQKAISFAALGNIYFNSGQYPEARTAYDSVSLYSSAAPNDSAVVLAARRVQLVDKIAQPARLAVQEDSLLRLASMSEKEQRTAVRRYIKALAQQRADSAYRAENAGLAGLGVNDGSQANLMSWYFGNPTMMQQGLTEFKRKWGNRPAVDNWRRSSAVAAQLGSSAPVAGGTTTTGNTTAPTQEDAGLDENGLPTEEALLAYIPNKPGDRNTAVNALQRAYVDMSNAYLRQFEDYTRAGAMLDTLDRRWTTNPYQAEATYLRYLIALRRNNLTDAKRYSDLLREKYNGTEWAGLVAPVNTDASQNGEPTASVGSYYDATYDLLQQKQYGEVLSRARNARRQFPTDENYNNRFRIIEAMAYAGSAQYKQADTILNTFISTHSNDPLKPWAETVLSYVKERRKEDSLLHPVIPAIPVDTVRAAATSGAPGAVNTSGTSSAAAPASIPAVGTAPVPGTVSGTTAGTAPATGTVSAARNSAPAPASGSNPGISPSASVSTAGTTSRGNTAIPDSNAGPAPAAYSYRAGEPHYFVFAVNAMEPRTMGVKSGLGDFNSMKFGDAHLQAEVVPMQGNKAMVVVKGLKNAAAAKNYLAQFRDTKQLVREYKVNEYQTFLISESNYRKLMEDRNIGPYMTFYRKSY
jgi:tetratricopeptide (TPR) repeat protein